MPGGHQPSILLPISPGALYLNTNKIESEPWWNRVDDQKLAETIKQLGIRFDTTVVLYGRDNTAAARAANILMYAGVDDVRLLNGGWKSWVNAGYITEPMLNKAGKHIDFGRPIPSRPELIIDVPEAKSILDDPEHQSLVSIRSWEEYIGNTSGYKYIKPKGRITGSKWGHAGSDAYHLEDFRNPDDTMISADIIEAFWRDWGNYRVTKSLLLLRHRMARFGNLLLCLRHGLGECQRLRRRLVRVER